MKIYLCSLFLFGLSLLLIGCTAKEDLRRLRDCPIEELLLSQSDYPPNTILNDNRSPIAEKPSESAGGSANYNGDATSQLVARHSSIENAVKEYEKWEKFTFDGDDVVGSWETPKILDFEGNFLGSPKDCLWQFGGIWRPMLYGWAIRGIFCLLLVGHFN